MKLTYASANDQSSLSNSAVTLQPTNISKDSHFAEHMEKGLLLPGGQARASVCETLDGHDCCHAESACLLAVRWD